ncbi:Precorrin-6A reductase [Thalassovita gelatinovora]|uniref:Precorrin-6A reductase n=1 Tax=Thalassovita gelatinovora TaxID=53501 RepID=A0A0P1FUC6_THAGE|nr:cobalt-precorrin-6A reductase [Thalassovita gelatinovora]QIZ79509.1 cobalt-precorrin-6A reductase [Thalassovita gelatinovora]CUH62937.1 Precorrin-6A reductase [Thalassovita gelatinovora]SEQ12742.1 precorrin-6A/cobalt-precorrin-6A reductase [Thalassovita gelatinovora]
MTLLLLAGTGEARQVAWGLSLRGVDAIASLAGATKSPETYAVPTRVGGFGGRGGFEHYLEYKNISAVLDVTHPFAMQISLRSAEVARQLGIPYCQLLRPAWQAEPGDDWTHVIGETGVVGVIPAGGRVFLATGRQTLRCFAPLSDCDLTLRVVDPQPDPFPLPNGRYLVARPPFTVESEIALFQDLNIDWLVVKNAGGEASYAKLLAARELGIKVVMIERPPQPKTPHVGTVEAALAWVDGL